ncbi:MAG: hypothetical protein CBD58_04305 [bacterium TMED198]|nr:MAG: hypothetical protein CBD58_04305 [bacterium TMED198]
MKEESYSNYLKLQNLLSSQDPVSKKHNNEEHDETLFIIVHQVFELWFKQIIHELLSIIDLLSTNKLDDRQLGKIVSRLDRIIKIQKILVDQFQVLETMTPMDFLEFRNLLSPASGFQSLQFRVIENLLGLPDQQRIKFSSNKYDSFLNEEEQKKLKNIIKSGSMFKLIDDWLNRTPFIVSEKFNFWEQYQQAVHKLIKKDNEKILVNPNLEEEEKNTRILENNKVLDSYKHLFDSDEHDKLLKSGSKRLSQQSTLAALFILLYRDEPMLHLPYKMITNLIDIDIFLTSWRHRHSLLARRMIGFKVGTGGSSGYNYLKKAVSRHSVFDDFLNLSSYLIPRTFLPKLPSELKSNLGYYFSHGDK